MNKDYTHFLKATGVLVVAALIAILTFSTNLWATYDYGKDTMRGEPELTKDADIKSSGLDKDYITNWSYGIGETWSFIIPNVKGGASGLLGNVDALDKADPTYRSAIAQQSNAYWGDQPGTSGPVYIGIIVIFLFILGMFILKGNLKWVLLSVTILSILLSWGRNWMPLTDFFIDFIPGYNKFRAVSMILVIAELAIPILAFLALGKVISDPSVLKTKKNALYISFGLTGGVALLFYLAPSFFFDFLSANEKLQFGQLLNSNDANQVNLYMTSLENVRIEIFKADAIRSFFIILIGAALVYLFSINKINKLWLLVGLGVLIVGDMASINRRYLNNDNFIRARDFEKPFKASAADNFIFSDKSEHRVLDLTKSTFNDASCSYFHSSIGGYHGAKLQRYQDLIEYNIQGEIETIINELSSSVTMEKINEMFKGLQTLNMLNAKYVIYNPEARPLINSSAFGNAWFVEDVEYVSNPDQEIAALKDNNLQITAIVDSKFKDNIKVGTYKANPSNLIVLESYVPNKLVYNYNSVDDQMVVFSEIYYDKGWNAYLDGEKVPYVRANYVLRAMEVPAGKHSIEFKFEPRIWVIGERISFISSLLLILLVIGTIGIEVKKKLGQKSVE